MIKCRSGWRPDPAATGRSFLSADLLAPDLERRLLSPDQPACPDRAVATGTFAVLTVPPDDARPGEIRYAEKLAGSPAVRALAAGRWREGTSADSSLSRAVRAVADV